MPFDCFSPFGIFGFSSAASPCQKQYESLMDSMGPSLAGPNQEALTYAAAMGLGCSQVQLDGAAAQRYPMQCTALLDDLEAEYQIVHPYGATVYERQVALLAAETLAAGATEANIEAGLTAILGSYFNNWRDLGTDQEVTANAGDNRDVRWILDGPVLTTGSVQANTRSVCYFEPVNTWVSVAYAGATSRVSTSSDDGITFAPVASSPLKPWTSVCWGSVAGVTKVVAVGETTGGDIQSVMTSDQGVIWSIVNAVEGAFQKVIFGGGLYVAVGDGVAMTSADGGATWFPFDATPIENHTWKSVAFGNGRYVAVSTDGYVAISLDGVNWGASSILTGDWNDIVFGNGVFVAVKTVGTYSARWSEDGVTWHDTNIPTRGLYTISFCDGLFVCADTTSTAYEIWTSQDGKTWTASSWLVTGHQWQTIAARPNRFVGVASSGASFRMKVLPQPKISPDYTPIKHVTLSGPILPGTRTVAYTALLTDGNALMTGEWVTVEPGRIGLQERVQITASSATTITATFAYPHDSGVRATTAPWPTWRSTKRHSLVVVNDVSVFTNRTLQAAVHSFMRKVMPASSTWVLVYSGPGHAGPFSVGSSAIGFSTIGYIATADP